jgi:formylglycine-generating enzyme required for sulfatase activity
MRMHGNVSEWCRDGCQEKLPGGTDPEVPETAPYRVYRDGSWVSTAWNCRSAHRLWNSPNYRTTFLGFRVALVQSGD